MAMVEATAARRDFVTELFNEIKEAGFELSKDQISKLRAVFKSNLPYKKGFSSALKVCQYVKAELLPEGADVNGLVVHMVSDMAQLDVTGWNNHPDSRCYIGHYLSLPEGHKVPKFIDFLVKRTGEVLVQKEFGQNSVLWKWEPHS